MPVLSTVGAASLRAFGAFGLQGSAASFIAATGGSVTTSGNYKYHTFTSSGTLSVTAAPAGKYIDVLLVGGGGASGGNLSGGGGGGVIINEGVEIGLGSYGITIGSAGNGVGVSGGNTTAFDLVALGGGGGGISGYSGSWVAGKSGGSGGGAGVIFGGPSASPISTPAGAGLQPTSESGGFGNNGGVGVPYPVGTGYGMVGAAGGGAGGAASGNTAGVGKSGLPLSSNLFGAGGAYDTQATQYGGGGGDISYNGYALGGIVIVRYLYQ
jgi:hypothetical protein